MKLACVVHRYGAEIAGGSESQCREYAERLAARHDVTVLTTCARDHVTWANAYPAGFSTINGVGVRRFPVAHRRRLKEFADLSDEVFSGDASVDREEAWFRENGPFAPALIEHLRTHGTSYDLVLFFSYRYYPTHAGLPLVPDRAVLVPTAEEDPAIRLGVLSEYFSLPAGLLFNTPEERTLVSARAATQPICWAITGVGVDPVPVPPPASLLEPLDIPSTYVLYLGRVERNKGCDTLMEYFLRFVETNAAVTLVLAGPAKMRIPRHPRIRALGYVSEELRLALLAHAQALVVPSPYESLSIVLLEAWSAGVPALVNGRCAVLAGQVRRANGGLLYRSAAEFGEALQYLLTHRRERETFGRQGLAYVELEYRWPVVLARVESLLADVNSRRS